MANLGAEGQRQITVEKEETAQKIGWRYDEFGMLATRQTKEVDVVLWSKVWAETSGSQSEGCSAHDDMYCHGS